MAGEKVFIGPKLRELRQSRNLTQAEIAKVLGVSASYINLIEHNQRSASLKFLISLTDQFGLDWRGLTNSDTGTLLADLRTISNDPVFGDAKPDVEELRSALEGSPNLVTGLVNIYNAYRIFGERLAEQSEASGANRDSRLSIEQGVHDFFRNNNNFFQELESCAETLVMKDRNDRPEFYGRLRNHLEQNLGVAVKHVHNEILNRSLRQYDEKNKVILLSDALDHNNKVFQLAHMVAQIEHGNVIESLLPEYLVSSKPAADRCRAELGNYFAAAILMPYDEFSEEAVNCRYDIDKLATRFSVSYEQVCHRLTTMQKPGKRGIPFFFLRIDRGGNVSKRFNATPIQLARYGGACPKLDVHYCFRVPGRILTQIVEMPDNSRYLTVNRTVDRPAVSFSNEDRRLSVSIGCPVEYAQDTVYGSGLDIGAASNITKVGINCRLCPRVDCQQRAHDAFHSDLQLNKPS